MRKITTPLVLIIKFIAEPRVLSEDVHFASTLLLSTSKTVSGVESPATLYMVLSVL